MKYWKTLITPREVQALKVDIQYRNKASGTATSRDYKS